MLGDREACVGFGWQGARSRGREARAAKSGRGGGGGGGQCLYRHGLCPCLYSSPGTVRHGTARCTVVPYCTAQSLHRAGTLGARMRWCTYNTVPPVQYSTSERTVDRAAGDSAYPYLFADTPPRGTCASPKAVGRIFFVSSPSQDAPRQLESPLRPHTPPSSAPVRYPTESRNLRANLRHPHHYYCTVPYTCTIMSSSWYLRYGMPRFTASPKRAPPLHCRCKNNKKQYSLHSATTGPTQVPVHIVPYVQHARFLPFHLMMQSASRFPPLTTSFSRYKASILQRRQFQLGHHIHRLQLLEQQFASIRDFQ